MSVTFRNSPFDGVGGVRADVLQEDVIDLRKEMKDIFEVRCMYVGVVLVVPPCKKM